MATRPSALQVDELRDKQRELIRLHLLTALSGEPVPFLLEVAMQLLGLWAVGLRRNAAVLSLPGG